ncbi:MAG: hypothetical protein QM674_10760 [Burkholderiaceae bacterium]
MSSLSPRRPLLHPAILAGILVNVGVLIAALIAFKTGSPLASKFVDEDALVEWLQFLCFTALSVLLFFIAWERLQREGRITWPVIALVGLGLVVALAAVEEVSWFQRVIGLESPEFFRQHNKQNETNLHNLAMGDASVHKRVLVKLIFAVGITHNLILPLLARRWPAVRRLIESLGGYLPPLSAAIVYLVLVAISQTAIDHPRRGELAEAFGAVHYLSTVFAAYVAGLGYGGPAVFDNPADRHRVSVLYGWALVFLVFMAWLLGQGYVPIPE